MARYRIAFIVMLALLAFPLQASAGGWAVASFDEVPGSFEAGSTYDLEYTVLQHGKVPVDVGPSEVRIFDSNGSGTVFEATATGETGRYSVSVNFPESGNWRWEVTLGDFPPQEMGEVEVAPPATGTSSMIPSLRILLPLALLALLGLIAWQVAGLAKGGRPGRSLGAD